MIDLNNIQKYFPQLKNGTVHYLDSAATSLTPVSVISAVDEYYFDYRANVHRGLFKEALRASERYEESRRIVASFLGATSANEVIFTAGATDASNMLVRMLEESAQLEGKSNIVTTVMEHHSALVPLQQLAKRRALELRLIPLSGFALNYEKAEELIGGDTAIVSIVLASNVTGMINDVRRIADLAHLHGAVVIVDATAAVGHMLVNVEALGADALYFSGHKMFATTGVGALWAKLSLLEKLNPSMFGGHMVARVGSDDATWATIPERFEAGTKDIGGVIGLGEAVNVLRDIDVSLIHAHTGMLVLLLMRKLEQIPGMRIFADAEQKNNAGMVSFTADWAHPHDIADVLARDSVSVRPGHHCAIPIHTAFMVPATTRASFHIYNTNADVDALIESLHRAKAIFNK